MDNGSGSRVADLLIAKYRRPEGIAHDAQRPERVAWTRERPGVVR